MSADGIFTLTAIKLSGQSRNNDMFHVARFSVLSALISAGESDRARHFYWPQLMSRPVNDGQEAERAAQFGRQHSVVDNNPAASAKITAVFQYRYCWLVSMSRGSR